MDSKYIDYIAKVDLKGYEYKILLMLLIRQYTPSQLVQELGVMQENVGKYIRSLKDKGLIEIDHVEGRNKFYRAITDIKKLGEIMPGQIKI